jgi:hypothetical protein
MIVTDARRNGWLALRRPMPDATSVDRLAQWDLEVSVIAGPTAS